MMFDTYPECGGFCLVDWVIDAPSGRSFAFRVATFLVLSLPIGTLLNIAWLLGIGRK